MASSACEMYPYLPIEPAVDEAKNFVSDEYDELLSNIDNFIVDNNKKIDTYKGQVASMDEKKE